MAEVVGVYASRFKKALQAYGVVEIGKGTDLDRIPHLFQGHCFLRRWWFLFEQGGDWVFGWNGLGLAPLPLWRTAGG